MLYAEDAPKLAAEGWVPVTHAWVADDWPTSAYIAATILVIVGIGIALLILFSLPSDADRTDAIEVLKRHGGHFINRFGAWSTEEVLPWRGPMPEIPQLMRR